MESFGQGKKGFYYLHEPELIIKNLALNPRRVTEPSLTKRTIKVSRLEKIVEILDVPQNRPGGTPPL